MEIRRAVKEDLPQINQLITDHPESKENRIIGFAQADEQQSEERVDQRPAGKLIQHTLVTKEKTEEIQKRFAEYLMLEAKKRKIKSFFVQF